MNYSVGYLHIFAGIPKKKASAISLSVFIPTKGNILKVNLHYMGIF